MTVAELVAKLGLDVKREDWDRAQSTMNRLKQGAEGLVRVFAVGMIARGIKSLVEGSIAAAQDVENLSEELGISTDRVQELAFAGKSIGQEAMSTSLRQLARHAYDASTKGGEAAATFAKMGVRIRDANGQLLPTDKLLENVADGMTKVKNPTERMAMATELFGRSGVTMLRVLKDGSAGMKKMYEEAQRLGTMSKEQIRLSRIAYAAQIRVDGAMQTLKNTITEQLLPGIIRLLNKIGKAVAWFTDLARNTEIVKEAMFALGIVMGVVAVKGLISMLMMLGPVGAAFLVFALIILFVVDEIRAAIRGGDTLGAHFSKWAGEVYDKFMNWKSISPIINGLLLPLKALVSFLKLSIDAFNALIMAVTGDFQGFKLLGANIKTEFNRLFEQTGIEETAKKWAAGDWLGRMSEERKAEIVAYRSALAAGKSEKEAQAIGMAVNRTGISSTDISGEVGQTVTPSTGAMVAGASSTASVGPLTVNQTINASPGQDAGAVGDAAAASFQGIHENMLEQTYNKLVPVYGSE